MYFKVFIVLSSTSKYYKYLYQVDYKISFIVAQSQVLCTVINSSRKKIITSEH